jgi:hypothetical protein
VTPRVKLQLTDRSFDSLQASVCPRKFPSKIYIRIVQNALVLV